MPDPDRDTESELLTDPRYDDWPIERSEGYTQWPVDRATPADDDVSERASADEGQWLGFTGAGFEGGTPIVYEPDEPALREGELDDENERLRVEEGHEGWATESPEAVRKRIREIEDEEGWAWVSPFVRLHLADETSPESVPEPSALERRHTDFTQKNVAGTQRADLAFEGSHTLNDETGRAHVIEREFDVFVDGPDDVTVGVDDRYLIAEGERQEDRAGDAAHVDDRYYEFEAHVDTDSAVWENELEAALKEWHEAHVASPAGEE